MAFPIHTPGASVIVRADNFDEQTQRIKNQIVRGTVRMVKDIAALARKYAAVDTGYMRDHITEDGTAVRSEAYYSGFVEWGTRFMAAQPFLRPAFEQVFANLNSYMQAGGIGGQMESPYYGGEGQFPAEGYW